MWRILNAFRSRNQDYIPAIRIPLGDLNDFRDNTETMKANLPQRTIQWLAMSRPASWFLAYVLGILDRWVLHMSANRHTATELLTGLPVVVVSTIGARSGEIIRVPLLGLPSDENIVLVATNFGNAHNPAWYHNLKKNPRIEVSRPEGTGIYESREVFDEEWSYYWQMVTRWYPGYRGYRHRASGRHIPILLLARVTDP